jgi:phenylacetate-CoA ligase
LGIIDFATRITLRSASPETNARRMPVYLSLAKRVENLRLRQTIGYAYERSPFYHKLFDEARLKPSDIKTRKDLAKIPFTVPRQLSNDPYQFLAVPRSQVFQVHTTAGTTGRPKKVFYTKREVESLAEGGAIMYSSAGMSKKDVAQIMFAFGGTGWMVGFDLMRGFERLGSLVIPAGTYPAPEEQIRTMQEYGVTVIAGTPSYIHRLTEEGESYTDLSKLGVRRILLAGEAWPESLRKRLREAWNAEVFDCYGMTEGGLGVECRMHDGLHVVDAVCITEIIDPKTGEVLEGEEEGELVFTHLMREASPLIRYRSGDISKFIPAPCGCGLPGRRIARVKGRSDDMIKLGTGENVAPTTIDSAVFEMPGVTEYQLVISRKGFQDLLTFRLEVEESKGDILGLLKSSLLSKLSFLPYDMEVSKTIAYPVVEILAPGSLKTSKIKTRRIIDLREK